MKHFKESNLNISKSIILSQVIGEICTTQNRTLWTRDKCSGLQLKPKESIDPIPKEKNSYFYDSNQMEMAMRLTQNATSIRFPREENPDREMWLQIDTINAFQTIAKQNCPQTYEDSPQTYEYSS